jgi:hypothetical protein
MKSPGYSQVIEWLSQIITRLSTNKELIKNSFDITGITQSDPERFHSALKHVLSSNDTSVTILEDLDGTEDLAETFLDDEEVEYFEEEDMDDTEDEAISDASSAADSSSDDDEPNRLMSPISETEQQPNQENRRPSDITQPNTENEEDISSIRENRVGRKRKNKSSENEPKHKIIRSDTNNKRKRATDDEHEESQRKKVFSNLTNLSTYNTRKNKK